MNIVGGFGSAILWIINTILTLYFWCIVIAVVITWLQPNPHNPIVRTLWAITEPVLYRVRRLLPFLVIGGIDLSPIAVLLLIQGLQIFINRTFNFVF